MSGPESGGVASFARGLEVLGALADNGPMRADAIAAYADMPLSTVYRYMRSLVAHGFVEAREGTYAPGERLAQMARTSGWSDQVLTLGTPVLRELAAATGESAVLTTRVGRSALVIDHVESAHAIRLSFQRGALLPLYAGASAKVLLAYAPRAVLADIIAEGLRPFTPRTPNERRLRQQLADIRADGHSVTHGEADEHAVGIGVPVFRGAAVACGLSVAGPRVRLEPGRIQDVLDQVTAAGARLTDALTSLAEAPRDHASGL